MNTEMNLIPPEYLAHRRAVLRERAVIAVLALLTLLCVLQYFICAFSRLAVLRERCDAALRRRDAALAEVEMLAKQWQPLLEEGQRWEKITAAAQDELPLLELLTRVFAAMPKNGTLEYVLADKERCRADILLPDGEAVTSLMRQLGTLRGYGAFVSGGRRLGSQGLPIFRFDAVRHSQ